MTAEMKGMTGQAKSRVPVHEQVYTEMRALILFGEVAPGEAVTIQGLTHRLDAGTTPVREALRRLISEGALVFQDNRRISVPVLGPEALEQLGYAREALEPELARRAASRIVPEEIDALREIDTALDRAIVLGDIHSYLRENYNFHATLNAIARAPVLTGLVEGLWLRFGPSLRVVCGQFGTRGLPDMHKAILAALEARDPEAAADAMLGDVRQGTDQMRHALR